MTERSKQPADSDAPSAAEGDETTWRDEREITLDAPADRVWRAWADPEIIAGWFADRARGKAVPGGELVHVFDSFGGMEMPYEVLEADRPYRLVLEAVAPSGNPFRQEVTVESVEGRTVLRIVHSGFDAGADWHDEIEGIDSGWKLALPILRHYLDRFFGRPRTVATAFRPAPLDWNRLRAAFTTADGLGSWLTRKVAREPSSVGEPVELVLDDDRPLRGTLLADSGRELAIEWPEIEGVLELKAFAAGPTGMVGLRAQSWHPSNDAADLQPLLDDAAQRLADGLEPAH